MHALAVLDYLPKLKRGPRLDFGAHFLHDFPIIFFSFNTLSMDTISISYLFYFPGYQTKCVKFLFRQLMMSQTVQVNEYLVRDGIFRTLSKM